MHVAEHCLNAVGAFAVAHPTVIQITGAGIAAVATAAFLAAIGPAGWCIVAGAGLLAFGVAMMRLAGR